MAQAGQDDAMILEDYVPEILPVMPAGYGIPIAT
jgi:hypothetical protein